MKHIYTSHKYFDDSMGVQEGPKYRMSLFFAARGNKYFAPFLNVGQTDRAFDWWANSTSSSKTGVHLCNPRQLLLTRLILQYWFLCKPLSCRPSFYPLGGLHESNFSIRWYSSIFFEPLLEPPLADLSSLTRSHSIIT